MRSRQLFCLLCILLFAGITTIYIRAPTYPLEITKSRILNQGKKEASEEQHVEQKQGQGQAVVKDQPKKPQPQHWSSHPVFGLLAEKEAEHQKIVSKQSKSLQEAVAEYRRRCGIPPPPNFDKWYEFAKTRGVVMIDEYDTIQETLTPFWAFSPATIRGRAREALGHPDNNLIGALIRKGAVTKIDGAWNDWQKNATRDMMKSFIQWLPDMDLPFNVHDEPRVVIPSSDLDRMVAKAQKTKARVGDASETLRNSWSATPKDMSDGSKLEDVKFTRFNVFAHQNVWTHSRMSCPPESPARILEDGPKEDNIASYTDSPLGFITNKTAFSDICQSPSLRETFGFFERPNAYNIVHDLFPIFSQSKLSSYADILYPSPWYWAGKVTYNETREVNWEKKTDRLYWRGSTTGGFSRAGGWRRQHRQKIVSDLNSRGNVKILENKARSGSQDWQMSTAARSSFRRLFDVFFTSVGQCDPEDCEAQKQFFSIKDGVDQQGAWQYKYLLDIDGNAFSGRFYAFLASKSLPFKMAIFREWHEEWLKPWVHYVPLSLRGDEWVETVRFFDKEKTGQHEAEKMAYAGREWSKKVLRNQDLEVWFFRLLLE